MSKKDESQIKCSFCGKGHDEVNRLVAGPGVYICDECIEVCFEILEGDDTQINVMRTLLGDKIVLAKSQSRHHIEVAMTTEEKKEETNTEL